MTSKVQREKKSYERNRPQKEQPSNKRTNSEESDQTHVHEFLASTKLAEEGETDIIIVLQGLQVK